LERDAEPADGRYLARCYDNPEVRYGS